MVLIMKIYVMNVIAGNIKKPLQENKTVDKSWIIKGSDKVGQLMSDGDRTQLFHLLSNQHRERRHGFKVTCPCGRLVHPAYQYRCFYCDVTFCMICAKIHFGKREHKISSVEE